MGTIPAINRGNVQLVALWVLLLLLIIMGWHFVDGDLSERSELNNDANSGKAETLILSRAA